LANGRNGIGPIETLQLIDLGDNKVAFRGPKSDIALDKDHYAGKYVCAENGGGEKLVCNRDRIDIWETFERRYEGDGKWSFRSHNGKYVYAENGGVGDLIANSDRVDGWEKFYLVDLTGTPIALLANNGQYVRSICDDADVCGGWLPCNVHCGLCADSKEIVDRAKFRLIDLGDNKIAFRNINGRYMSARNGQLGVIYPYFIISDYEVFERRADGNGRWVFRAYNNQFIHLDPDKGDGSVLADGNGGESDSWELFGLEIQDPIQNVINRADSGSTIHLKEGIYRRQRVNIDRSVNIIGKGSGRTIVDGSNTSSVFTTGKTNPDIDVKLSSMTIRGGSGSFGGGIYNLGRLIVEKSIITGNTVGGVGGGIYNSYGMVTLNSDEITKNTAESAGGGIYTYGGIVTMNGGKITENNARWGGGVNNIVGRVIIDGGYIEHNGATNGGGVCNSGTLDLKTGNIISNTAQKGGGILNAGTLNHMGGHVADNIPDNIYDLHHD
jgi:hypothetical protein